MHTRVGVVVALALASAPARAAEPADLAAAAERYFDEENLYNGVYVALGATNAAVGAALATRDDDGLGAAGYPLIAIGGAQLVVGVVYLAITPGWRADAAEQRERGASPFLAAQRERMASVEGAFVYYKLIDAAVVLAGLGLGIAGAAAQDDALLGAGVGLGVGGVGQLTMEHITHDVAKSYLRTLDRAAAITVRW